MIKEECRISLVLLTLGIICKAEGIKLYNNIRIGKDTYHTSNEELIYNKANEENSQNYNNANVFEKINAIQYEDKEFPKKTKEKLMDSIVPMKNVNSENELQLENRNEIQSNFINNVYKDAKVENNQPEAKSFKKRQDYMRHFRPGRKSPVSYLHTNKSQNKKNHLQIYNFDASMVNEDLIRRFTGPSKKYFFPKCEINEYSSVRDGHASDNLKRDLNSHETIFNSNSNHKGLRKIRSRWADIFHFNSPDKHNIQEDIYISNNNSPLVPSVVSSGSEIKNDEKRKLRENSMKDDQNISRNSFCANYTNMRKINSELVTKTPDIYGNQVKPENIKEIITIGHFSNSQIYGKMEIVTDKNKCLYETEAIASGREMAQNSNNKTIDNLPFLSPINKNLAINLPMENINKKTSFNSNYKDTILAIPSETLNNFNLIQTSIEKDTNGAVLDLQKSHSNEKYTEHNNTEHNSINQSEIKHEIKNKITQAPLHTVNPNISFIYLQPIPVSNSMDLQKMGVGYSVLSPNISADKISDSIKTIENKSADLITISIDPKTLQNKILHAEFFKKSDTKKTPDMLSIELSPKETYPSKQQKPVSSENTLKISASVKNNTIIITSDDKTESQTGIIESSESLPVLDKVDRKMYLEQSGLFGRPEKDKSIRDTPGVISDRKKKSIALTFTKTYDIYNEDNVLKPVKCMDNWSKPVMCQTKIKEPCGRHGIQTTCKMLTTSCNNMCNDNGMDSNDGTGSTCHKTTFKATNFKEIHEGMRGSRQSNYEMQVEKSKCPENHLVKTKREVERMNISKLMNLLKPVFVLSQKEDSEGSEDESADRAAYENKVNLRGSSEVTFEKGNKKVENKILEGFINSIIANYSRDETKQTKETTEKNEDGTEPLLKLLENNVSKGIDKEEPDDKASWNLTPILVPESSISKYSDSSEYAKLGPFDESAIKSLLKKDSIPFLQEKVQQVDQE